MSANDKRQTTLFLSRAIPPHCSSLTRFLGNRSCVPLSGCALWAAGCSGLYEGTQPEDSFYVSHFVTSNLVCFVATHVDGSVYWNLTENVIEASAPAGLLK